MTVWAQPPLAERYAADPAEVAHWFVGALDPHASFVDLSFLNDKPAGAAGLRAFLAFAAAEGQASARASRINTAGATRAFVKRDMARSLHARGARPRIASRPALTVYPTDTILCKILSQIRMLARLPVAHSPWSALG